MKSGQINMHESWQQHAIAIVSTSTVALSRLLMKVS